MAIALISVVLVDDHGIVRDGMRSRLEREGFAVVAEASSGADGIAAAKEHTPDVVILDLGLPDRGGVSVCRELKALLPETKVVIVSALKDDDLVTAALEAGASAYLLKDAENFDLIGAVRGALAGENVLDPRVVASLLRTVGTAGRPQISEQERKVLRLAAQGKSNREIGALLYLSPHTVKEYLKNAMRKLEVDSRVQAVLEANRRGLLD